MPSIIRKLTQHFSRSSQSGETLKTTPIRGLSGRFYSNPTQKNPPDKELASIKLSLQKKSKHNVDDDDVALLAKILSHPLALPPTGPASMKLSKLSDTHLKSLALKYNDLSDARNNILANKHEALSKSLEFPTLINLTELIQVNSISGRPVEAQLAFDHIIEIGLIPDVVAYNNLLNAYAAGHNIEQMDRVLGEMRKSSLEFDIVTFSILIKCYSQTNRVEEAFEVLAKLKESNLKPNQIIISTLISACIRTKQYDRAWKIFTYLKTEVEQPDTVTYNMMISMCSFTKECEKALDLFEEMASFKQPVDSITFTSLINACASRPDYYNECFNICVQMAEEGYKMEKKTLDVLLHACANYGDLERARLVWNEIHNWENDDGLNKRENFSVKNLKSMFMVYAIGLHNNSKGKGMEPKLLNSLKDGNDLVKDMTEVEKQGDNPISVSVIDDPSQYPYLDDEADFKSATMVTESQKIWKVVNENIINGSLKPTTELLDSYLWILCKYPNGELESSLQFYKEAYHSYKLPYSGRTFVTMLRLLSIKKKEFEPLCVPLFADLLAWDNEIEKNMLLTNPSQEERERRRVLEGRGMKNMRTAFLCMIKGYARIKDVNKSLETIEALLKFRRGYYLSSPTFKEIKGLVDECTCLADKGDWEPLKKLLKLCPKPEDPMKPVRDALGRKTIPKNWWGWKVIGENDGAMHKRGRKFAK